MLVGFRADFRSGQRLAAGVQGYEANAGSQRVHAHFWLYRFVRADRHDRGGRYGSPTASDQSARQCEPAQSGPRRMPARRSRPRTRADPVRIGVTGGITDASKPAPQEDVVGRWWMSPAVWRISSPAGSPAGNADRFGRTTGC